MDHTDATDHAITVEQLMEAKKDLEFFADGEEGPWDAALDILRRLLEGDPTTITMGIESGLSGCVRCGELTAGIAYGGEPRCSRCDEIS